MKIIMFVRLFSPHKGGVERHVEEVSWELAKNNNEITIITGQFSSTLPLEETMLKSGLKSGIKILRIPNLIEYRNKSFFKKLEEKVKVWIFTLSRVSLFYNADVIHIHDIFWWYWPIKILFPNKKVFITFHGFEAGNLPTSKSIKARHIATNMTNGNICIGGWIKKWYGTEPNFVLYGAANCTNKHKIEKKPTDHRSFKAIFLGRLDDDTGIMSYVKAVSKFNNWHLDIFGKGKFESEMRHIGTKQKNICYLGATNNSCHILINYDVAFVSSYLSILEAMQSNVPVVAIATDELKVDYLEYHPAAKFMHIVKSQQELRKLLSNWDIDEARIMAKSAYEWGKQQTWGNVALVYNKLWQI